MHDDGFFGEPVAARYDETSAGMFAPEIVDPAVELLAGLAGDGRTFALAYLVFNTISNLTTQAAQVACFANAAAHLEPGGCFVIEVGIPELRRLPPGETVRPFQL